MSSQSSFNASDLANVPMDVPSLCIPRVFHNITKERVESVLRELDIGHIQRVDIISRTDEKGDVLKRVFIHLLWNKSSIADQARIRLLSGHEIKIIYDGPWFWKVSANRSQRTVDNPRSGIKIDLCDSYGGDSHLKSSRYQGTGTEGKGSGGRGSGGRGGRGSGGGGRGRGRGSEGRGLEEKKQPPFEPFTPDGSPPNSPSQSENNSEK
jgi:uncharacterized membrane protein YgcG